MELGLAGLRAVVTGGTRGIGRAIVGQLAAEGADVAFCARDAARVAATAAELAGHGSRIFGEPLDVGDADAYRAWLARAAEALGGVDIFIPNVSGGASTESGDAPWRRAFEIDLMHSVRGAETLLPHLARSQAAGIVLVSSIAAVETFLAPTAYGAIKAALLTWSKQFAKAVAKDGVRVNAVSPGPVHVEDGDWGRVQREVPDFYAQIEARCGLGRLPRPEDVARAVLFLASPAAAMITGTNLVIDAGFTERVQF